MKSNNTKLILLVIILFVTGSLFHFLYNLSDQNILIGLIAPVNESIWEHTKMITIPYIIIFMTYYFINKNNIDINKWLFSLLISIIIGIILVPVLYYFYTESFGIDLVIIDILILLLTNILTVILFHRIYNNIKDTPPWYVSLLFLINIVFIYLIFTFNPPKLPIFIDKSTGYFGI